jgi:hypothetical protein
MTLDDPIIFYLKHRASIHEWYGLRLRLSPVVHDFFSSIDLAALGQELGDVTPDKDVDGLYPVIRLARRSWSARIAVGLGWERTDGVYDFEHGYGGVCISNDHPAVASLETLRLELHDVGKEAGYKRTRSWPAWRYVKPPTREYWTDLDRFRTAIVDDIRQAWERFAPVIDAGLVKTSASL